MQKHNCLLLICFLFSCTSLMAQLEKVIVEKYYLSDELDASDINGGHLEPGSTTYRIFIDLKPDSRLISVFGEENHPLIFSSTTSFFNHIEEGVSFGKDFNRNRYGVGTTPLDTYLTLGQCSRAFSQQAYFGVPKETDTDASLVGGINNDGGSAHIPGGLLVNHDPVIGLPLTSADGLVVSSVLPGAWISIGFEDIVSGEDTTIFGSSLNKLSFNSVNSLLKNSGVTGVDPIENKILIAQLTTKGELSFSLNLEIEFLVEGVPKKVKYMANQQLLEPDEIFNPQLKYPYTCGCKDPGFLESNTEYACSDPSACVTPVLLGCMDSLACNYDPNANLNVSELCCYPGYCHDLDLSLVCPDLHPRKVNESGVRLFPNPAITEITVEFDWDPFGNIPYSIWDAYGRIADKGRLMRYTREIDVFELTAGYYYLKLETTDKSYSIPFVKQ